MCTKTYDSYKKTFPELLTGRDNDRRAVVGRMVADHTDCVADLHKGLPALHMDHVDHNPYSNITKMFTHRVNS